MLDKLERELFKKTSKYISLIESNIKSLKRIENDYKRICDNKFDELFKDSFLMICYSLAISDIKHKEILVDTFFEDYSKIATEHDLSIQDINVLIMKTFHNKSYLEEYLNMSHEEITEIYNEIISKSIENIKFNKTIREEAKIIYRQEYKRIHDYIKETMNILKEYLEYVIASSVNKEIKEKYIDLVSKIQFMSNDLNDSITNDSSENVYNSINTRILYTQKFLIEPYKRICSFNYIGSSKEILDTFEISIKSKHSTSTYKTRTERKYAIIHSFTDIEKYMSLFKKSKKLSKLCNMELYKQREERECIISFKSVLESDELKSFEDYNKNKLRLMKKNLDNMLEWFSK